MASDALTLKNLIKYRKTIINYDTCNKNYKKSLRWILNDYI